MKEYFQHWLHSNFETLSAVFIPAFWRMHISLQIRLSSMVISLLYKHGFQTPWRKSVCVCVCVCVHMCVCVCVSTCVLGFIKSSQIDNTFINEWLPALQTWISDTMEQERERERERESVCVHVSTCVCAHVSTCVCVLCACEHMCVRVCKILPHRQYIYKWLTSCIVH